MEPLTQLMFAVYASTRFLSLGGGPRTSTGDQPFSEDGHSRSRREDPPLLHGRDKAERHFWLLQRVDDAHGYRRWRAKSLRETGRQNFRELREYALDPSYSSLQSYGISGRRSPQPGCFPLARRGENRPTIEFIHPLWGGPPRMPRKRRQPRFYHSHDEGRRKFRQSPASAGSARPAEENPASRRLLYFHASRPRQLLAVSRQ